MSPYKTSTVRKSVRVSVCQWQMFSYCPSLDFSDFCIKSIYLKVTKACIWKNVYKLFDFLSPINELWVWFEVISPSLWYEKLIRPGNWMSGLDHPDFPLVSFPCSLLGSWHVHCRCSRNAEDERGGWAHHKCITASDSSNVTEKPWLPGYWREIAMIG